jgi:hypothetical protein
LIAASVSIYALQNSQKKLEGDQLYRQAEFDHQDAMFSLIFQRFMAKYIPSEALPNMTVQANPGRDKNLHAVSYTDTLGYCPAIDLET